MKRKTKIKALDPDRFALGFLTALQEDDRPRAFDGHWNDDEDLADPYFLEEIADAVSPLFDDDPEQVDAFMARVPALLNCIEQPEFSPWLRTAGGTMKFHPALLHAGAVEPVKDNGRFAPRKLAANTRALDSKLYSDWSWNVGEGEQ